MIIGIRGIRIIRMDWENRRFRRVRRHVYRNRNLHTILNCYVVILNI